MMTELVRKHWRFGVVLLLIVGLMLWRYFQGDVEQDNYLEYAQGLRGVLQGQSLKVNYNDTRLLPGLPLLILLLNSVGVPLEWAGYTVVLLAVTASYFLMYRYANGTWVWATLVFPPILLEQASVIGTEWVMVALMLGGLIAVKEKKWVAAGFLLGFGVWVRLAMVPVLMVVGLWLMYQKKRREGVKLVLSALLPVVLLGAYNGFVFGWQDLFHQLSVYPEYGRASMAVVQLMQDIPRALDWGWWRQVVSGLFYLILLGVGLVWGYRLTKNSASDAFKRLLWWVVVILCLFVFSVGPTPFLEEFARFLVPVFVLLWLIVSDELKSARWQWVLLLVSTAVVVA